MRSVDLQLVPDVEQVLGEFTVEFEFRVRLAELDGSTLAMYSSDARLVSINAASSRAEQSRAFGEFLDLCAAHQRNVARPVLGLACPTSVPPA